MLIEVKNQVRQEHPGEHEFACEKHNGRVTRTISRTCQEKLRCWFEEVSPERGWLRELLSPDEQCIGLRNYLFAWQKASWSWTHRYSFVFSKAFPIVRLIVLG